MKLRVSGGPPNYRQSLPHQVRFWHGCQSRQVDLSTILVLVETARRGSCSRLRGIVGIFGAHELPGGVAKAVMILLLLTPLDLGFYLTEELRNNSSMRFAIARNCQSRKLCNIANTWQENAG